MTRRRSIARPRGGFTLLEVLVALALATLLMAAIYSGLSLYWRSTSSGQEEANRAQVARTILRQIELDLRSVVYQSSSSGSGGGAATQNPAGGGSGGSSGGGGQGGRGGAASSASQASSAQPAQAARAATAATAATRATAAQAATAAAPAQGTGSGASGGGGGSGGGGSSGGGGASGTSEPTTPDAAYSSSSSGLFGDATTLMLHVSKPSRTEGYAPFADAAAAGGRTSDLMAIAYFTGGQGGGALQSAVTQPGLARMAGDRLLMSIADDQGNTSFLASKTEILAPEVAAISFEYFDGSTWLTSWDSSSQGGLPRAVAILLELHPPAGQRQVRQTSWGLPTENMYRLIVALPAAGASGGSSSQ